MSKKFNIVLTKYVKFTKDITVTDTTVGEYCTHDDAERSIEDIIEDFMKCHPKAERHDWNEVVVYNNVDLGNITKYIWNIKMIFT